MTHPPGSPGEPGPGGDTGPGRPGRNFGLGLLFGLLLILLAASAAT
jgi:hypothetical protein